MTGASSTEEGVLDVVLVDTNFTLFAALNSFADNLFDYMAVFFEDCLQFAKVTRTCMKEILDRIIFDEASTLFAIDQNGKGNTPILAIWDRADWKFDMHWAAFVLKKVIVA